METPPEIRYLIAAVFLSEDLSFTRAAKRLKLSQSGLSRRLNELESRCGVKLFTRDHAHVSITDAGRAFVEEAKLSILHSESAIQSAKRAHSGVCLASTILFLQRQLEFPTDYADSFSPSIFSPVHE